jgi:hypothetical protein
MFIPLSFFDFYAAEPYFVNFAHGFNVSQRVAVHEHHVGTSMGCFKLTVNRLVRQCLEKRYVRNDVHAVFKAQLAAFYKFFAVENRWLMILIALIRFTSFLDLRVQPRA